ncbi:MAG: dTDP-4-dehydrorhamnose reductase [Chloroflexi bacterium]|nr:dTDP-4-dehydrorhamnose reductase [Chloroflexota bacterium]
MTERGRHRILITGANGQLGIALQHALAGEEVTALGRSELDVTDEAAVLRTFDELTPAVVIHAAAWTDTAGCEKDPVRATKVNALAAGIVAEASRDVGAVIVYISSNEVFDGVASEPYTEDAAPNPVNEYGRSKLGGETEVRDATERHYIVRTSWLYGPGRTSFPEKIVHAARERGQLKLVTDEIASPTWTVDLAAAIAELIKHPQFGIYHLTNAGAASRKEWADEVLKLASLSETSVETTTLAEYGGPYRKPMFSALANIRAAKLGIELRPWREALACHQSAERGSKQGVGVPDRLA